MKDKNIIQDIASLPPEAQKRVEQYISILKTLYVRKSGDRQKKIKLKEEPFIGMWKDREDLKDSAIWVREQREREWKKSS